MQAISNAIIAVYPLLGVKACREDQQLNQTSALILPLHSIIYFPKKDKRMVDPFLWVTEHVTFYNDKMTPGCPAPDIGSVNFNPFNLSAKSNLCSYLNHYYTLTNQ